MQTNQDHLDKMTAIQKADFTLSHLLGNGGYLMPGQAQEFLQIAIKQAQLMGQWDVMQLKEYKYRINRMRFSSRVMRPGTVGQALPVGDRVRPDIGQVELDVQLIKFSVLIEEEVFEDNIEGERLKNKIMKMLGEAAARDTEDLLINGDTTSADPFYAKLDGMIKQTTSHTKSAGSATLASTMLLDAIKLLPQEYRYPRNEMRFYTSANAELDYSVEIESRETPRGDKAMEEWPGSTYKRSPVEGVPLFPENLGVGNDETVVIYCKPSNFKVGFHNKIKIRTEEDPDTGAVMIYGRLRVDGKWANEDETVKIYEVKAA